MYPKKEKIFTQQIFFKILLIHYTVNTLNFNLVVNINHMDQKFYSESFRLVIYCSFNNGKKAKSEKIFVNHDGSYNTHIASVDCTISHRKKKRRKTLNSGELLSSTSSDHQWTNTTEKTHWC